MITFRPTSILLLTLVFSLAGCTPHAVREAQRVVAEADSLWHNGQMYGVDAGDSATLAQAYETLGAIPFPIREGLELNNTFTRSCYHYGKLLRKKDNPVEAMQAFIRATHAHSRDYHYLGRIYSNMGDICHRAGDDPLSYDMFERSGEMFLKSGDTLMYYYDLNNMAFVLAEQGKKEEMLTLLNTIENQCMDSGVLNKVIETKIVGYEVKLLHDSVIYYSTQLLNRGYKSNTVLLNRAKAYSYIGEKDSAVYYANIVLLSTNELYDKNNALYILTNDDKSKSKETIRESASNRADIQKIIEDNRSETAQAAQLLKLYRNHKPDWTWLYTIIIAFSIIWIYVYRKRHQHALLSQQIEDLIIKKKEALSEHEQFIQEHAEYTSTLLAQMAKNCAIIYNAEDFPNNIYWKDFDAMSKLINNNFGMLVTKLQHIYQLSEKEIRLCILVLLGNPSGKTLANLLFYGERGIRTYKNRIAQKMGTNSTEMRVFLIKLAINEHSKCSH